MADSKKFGELDYQKRTLLGPRDGKRGGGVAAFPKVPRGFPNVLFGEEGGLTKKNRTASHWKRVMPKEKGAGESNWGESGNNRPI